MELSGSFTITLLTVGWNEKEDRVDQKPVTVYHRADCTVGQAQYVTNAHAGSLAPQQQGNFLYVFKPREVWLTPEAGWVPEPAVTEPAGISVPVFPRKVRSAK